MFTMVMREMSLDDCDEKSEKKKMIRMRFPHDEAGSLFQKQADAPADPRGNPTMPPIRSVNGTCP